MTSPAALSPRAFCDYLLNAGITRFYLVWDADAGRVIPSHPAVEPLADLLQGDHRDFDQHEGVFCQVAPDTGVLQGAFIHRTCRGQAAGGVRYWSYPTVEAYLRDGLRLGRGMTLKNALAGIWWGGGKGVMARDTGASGEGPPARLRVYEEYGAFISSLRGCYVTAEDVGTSVEDMAAVFAHTRFTTCIPPRLGGSGNPSVPTARGVVRGMEAALAHLGLGDLGGKTVTVQGLGHVGEPLLGFLEERGVARVIGSEIDPTQLERVRRKYPRFAGDLNRASPGDTSIFAEPTDILSPCAVGGVLGPDSIPHVAARIVCGAANNQLEDQSRDDGLLAARGILYVPDFLVNRMGIVNCADEQFGYVSDDPHVERHLDTDWEGGIYRLALRVLDEAHRTGRTPERVALEEADRRSREEHPLWGHRGARIIRSLVTDGWANPPG